MHVTEAVSIGNLITWAITAGSALITVGKLSQILLTLKDETVSLRADFNEHQRDDHLQFERLYQHLAFPEAG